MELRIKEVCKEKKVSLQELADRIGKTYTALYSRMSRNMSVSNLKQIAEALNVEPAELIETGKDYAHFYDDKTGEWLGIRKK